MAEGEIEYYQGEKGIKWKGEEDYEWFWGHLDGEGWVWGGE